MNINIEKSINSRFLILKTATGTIGILFTGALFPVIISLFITFSIFLDFTGSVFLNLVIASICCYIIYKYYRMYRFDVMGTQEINFAQVSRACKLLDWRIVKNNDNEIIAKIDYSFWISDIYFILIEKNGVGYFLFFPDLIWGSRPPRIPIPNFIQRQLFSLLVKGLVTK